MPIQTLRWLSAATLLLLGTTTGHSAGPLYREISDAGFRPGSAPVLPPGVSRITGTLKAGTTSSEGANPVDVDVYVFSMLSNPSLNEIRVPSTPQTPNPSLLLMQKIDSGYTAILGVQGMGLDAVISVRGLQGTYAIAVSNNPLVGFSASGSVLIPGLSSEPIVAVGTAPGVVTPTGGESYELIFNFKTQVTGLNLTIGKKVRSDTHAGIYTVNASGKGQTISVSGKSSARFNINAILLNRKGPVSIEMNVPSSLRLRQVISLSAGENVTAAFLSGRYRSPLTVENIETLAVVVEAPARGVTRVFPRPPASPRGKVLTRAYQANNRGGGDTVGAIVKLRP